MSAPEHLKEPSMDLQLKGRVALVTGASAGLGRGIVATLAAEGVQLALLARRRPLLEEAAAEAVKLGAPKPLIIVADMADAASPTRIRDELLKGLGHVEILVNNAGGSQPAVINEADDSWERGMMINFVNIRRLTEALLPSMRRREYGRIINIGGTHEPIGINVTGSAKAALQFYAKALSDEVGKDGITVNTIIPNGVVNQRLSQRLKTKADEEEYVRQSRIAVGRVGQPADIGALVAFLVSPQASYINGQVLYCDGGMHRYAY